MMTIGPAGHAFGHSSKFGFALPGVTSRVAVFPAPLGRAF
jgi:hypothetical protein